MSVIDTLLKNNADDWRVTDVYVGDNWILSLVVDSDGNQRAGVATAPKSFSVQAAYPIGHHQPPDDLADILELLRSSDTTAAGVGLATINALQHPDTTVSRHDAADWLSENSKGKALAIFGRFPFIDDEIRPFARDVFVFEQEPQSGEYAADDMATMLPQAELVAITGSTVVNHTLDSILKHIPSTATTVLLGPSTPMTPRLFSCGIDGLFGVHVADIKQAIESIQSGVGFQKMHGLERVSLFKTDVTNAEPPTI